MARPPDLRHPRPVRAPASILAALLLLGLTTACERSETERPAQEAPIAPLPTQTASNVVDALAAGFREPPPEARPGVRWWWNGNAVQRASLERELEGLSAAGFGHVEINPIALPEDATHAPPPLPWLSPEWNAMVRFAVDQAERRGLRTDLLLGGGWPFGGAFLESEQTAQALRLRTVPVAGPARVPVPPLPEGSRRLFLRAVPAVAEPMAGVVTYDPAATEIDVPPGPHVIYDGLRAYGVKRVYLGAPGSAGPALDHYSKTAVRQYLERISTHLGPALGGRLGDALQAAFCDSVELRMANWNGDMTAAFAEQHDYDITPWLPFVLRPDLDPGWSRRFIDLVRRVRHDFHATLATRFRDEFVATFAAWAREQGVASRLQAHGAPWVRGPLEAFGLVDVPEGEHWANRRTAGEGTSGQREASFPVWNTYASSAAHVAGRPVVSSETMTNVDQVFRMRLEDLKRVGDLNLVTGVSQTILHGFNHSPRVAGEAGFPGWIRYGTYVNEHNPWWRHVRRWTDYQARLSWVFRESRATSQLAILGPQSDVWGAAGMGSKRFLETPWYLQHLWRAAHQGGYTADFVSEGAVVSASADEGRIRIGEQTYDALLLARVASLGAEAAGQLAELSAARAQIVFIDRVPARTPGLAGGDIERSLELDREIATTLQALVADPRPPMEHGPAPGARQSEIIAWLSDVLSRRGVRPGTELLEPDPYVFHTRRRHGDRTILFFANVHGRDARALAIRMPTGETHGSWARWDPETGERSGLALEAGVLRRELQAGESLLLVSDDTPAPTSAPAVEPRRSLTLEGPWQLELSAVDGVQSKTEVARLGDLSRARDPALRHFGGLATYRLHFSLDDVDYTHLELGEALDAARVTLNGSPLGVRWWGRPRFEIGAHLRSENELEIEVATSLWNHARARSEGDPARAWARGDGPVPMGLVGPVRLLGPDRPPEPDDGATEAAPEAD